MSYDLFVFSSEHAPRDREAFLNWCDSQTDWEDGQRYGDPKRTTDRLQAWFMEMIRTFPPMNGPLRQVGLKDDDRHPSDYGVNDFGIYVGFSWSLAVEAYEATFRLAGKHHVGFFDASSFSSAVWVPDGKGSLVLLHEDSGANRPDA